LIKLISYLNSTFSCNLMSILMIWTQFFRLKVWLVSVIMILEHFMMLEHLQFWSPFLTSEVEQCPFNRKLSNVKIRKHSIVSIVTWVTSYPTNLELGGNWLTNLSHVC
jgi:hypothetical protein